MIDLHSESLLTFAEAARLLPGHVHLSTLHRWRVKGVRGVKLDTCLIGGRRFTSAEAIQRFSDESSAASTHVPPRYASLCRRTRQQKAAEARLAKDGI